MELFCGDTASNRLRNEFNKSRQKTGKTTNNKETNVSPFLQELTPIILIT